MSQFETDLDDTHRCWLDLLSVNISLVSQILRSQCPGVLVNGCMLLVSLYEQSDPGF